MDSPFKKQLLCKEAQCCTFKEYLSGTYYAQWQSARGDGGGIRWRGPKSIGRRSLVFARSTVFEAGKVEIHILVPQFTGWVVLGQPLTLSHNRRQTVKRAGEGYKQSTLRIQRRERWRPAYGGPQGRESLDFKTWGLKSQVGEAHEGSERRREQKGKGSQ